LLHVLYHGGARHAPRTGGQMKVSLVGEVKILLPEYLAISKSMDPLSRFLQEEEGEPRSPGSCAGTPTRRRQRSRSLVKMLSDEFK